jgi:hypothetical protein
MGDPAMNELLPLLAQAEAEPVGLTLGGAVIMGLSTVLVLGLLIFCMSRVLRESRPEDPYHSPLDADPRDLDT